MSNELSVLLQAVNTAGAAVLALSHRDLTVTLKENNDIVTQGDLLVNQILKSALLSHFPNDGWLSEESVDTLSRREAKRIWIVDPIDGTREFAKGVPEYAISVALIEDEQPILAVVYNPATSELFHAVKGKGAWLNDQAIICREYKGDNLLLLASRSEYRRGEWSAFEVDNKVQQIGSIAYKLGLVAAGKADATFSLGPKNEWDIAAGVLLVQEAGGVVTDQRGQPFVFNQENVLVDGIVATSQQAHAQIAKMIAV